MSGATFVPETRELTGEDAVATLRRVGRGALLNAAFRRLRDADGFSHARSLAYLTSLVAIQSLIAIVGTESLLGQGGMSRAIDGAISRVVPGPAGQVLTSAVTHAHQSGTHHHYLALLVGLAGSLVTATTAMAQLERGLNRIYGLDHDRPALQKYKTAFVSALSAGTLTSVAFVLLAFGDQLFGAKSPTVLSVGWAVVRWPIGVGLVAVATTVLFRRCPRRRQPDLSWLAFGSAVAVVVWVLSIVGLGLFFRFSSSFGSTYGPLAGVVALLLWSLLSSVSLLFGGAVAAQLESVRAANVQE
jgi:YihY family inner membrane protein